MRYPMECNLVGDAQLTLRALVPLLVQKDRTEWRESIEKGVRDWWKLMEERSQIAANPINPQRVFWELSPRLPDDAILIADSGSAANWYARDLRLKSTMMGTLSGALATMGCGVPYAIAAKFAHPTRPTIAAVGDGAMQMNGMAELLTVAKYWRGWQDPRLVIMVLNNQDLNQVTWEMRAMAGDTRYEASQELPAMNFAAFAEMVGLRGIRVEKPEEIAPAWEAALSADRPTVLDVLVDPNVPPLPPHITLKQAKAFTMSVLGGDPDRKGFIKQAVEQIFPGLASKG
jgi:pyruvate dehydrogenase (quinone)